MWMILWGNMHTNVTYKNMNSGNFSEANLTICIKTISNEMDFEKGVLVL